MVARQLQQSFQLDPSAVRAMGGLRYGAAAHAVRRFAARLAEDAAKVRFVEGMKRKLRERSRAK